MGVGGCIRSVYMIGVRLRSRVVVVRQVVLRRGRALGKPKIVFVLRMLILISPSRYYRRLFFHAARRGLSGSSNDTLVPE
jgi:hypothetical protein